MADFLSNPWFIGIATSIIGGVVLILYKGWWRGRKPESIKLATRVLIFLEEVAADNTRTVVNLTKELGESLIASFRTGAPLDSGQNAPPALELIEKTRADLIPLFTELMAAGNELDHLKRALIEYDKGMSWRAQIIRHLTNPPNRQAMDGSTVRSQMLDENNKPTELLNDAKGEAALFLRGPGTSWRYRFSNYLVLRKKHRAAYSEALADDYRKLLRQTAYHHARK